MAGFYMTIHPTGDEIVLIDGRVDEEGVQVSKEVTARVWRGHTNSGHPIELAVLRIIDAQEEDKVALDKRCQELLEAGEG